MRTRAEYVRAETAALLDSLRGVWDETAVDEWAHALQAAACAIADDADEELILAAALHDIGHSPLLGGPGVAYGYFHRPEKTAKSFVPNPFGFESKTLYHSGDLVRWTQDTRPPKRGPHTAAG